MIEKSYIKILNFGIISSISWNSNNWADNPSDEDLKASKYDYVKSYSHMHESLNFGHEKYPSEEDGYYIGYTPMFNRPPDIKNSRNVKVIFFTSSDYKNNNRKAIIGLYGFPIFGDTFIRYSKIPLFEKYDSGNIKASPENIIYFENPLIINNEIVKEYNFLPIGKKISQQGFNYLDSNNVFNLIKQALSLNPLNTKLKKFVEKSPKIEKLKEEEFAWRDFIETKGDLSADTLKDIQKLERKMKNLSPESRQRISNFIERGTISSRVKKVTGYKCLVCEALANITNSFVKKNDEAYIETHHVDPVSTLKIGVLSVTNLITVCANHHRQLHYGKVELLENAKKYFTYMIDDKTIRIEKISI